MVAFWEFETHLEGEDGVFLGTENIVRAGAWGESPPVNLKLN